MIDTNQLQLLKSQCETDLRSIGAGTGLTLGIQKERIETLTSLLDELDRLSNVIDGIEDLAWRSAVLPWAPLDRGKGDLSEWLVQQMGAIEEWAALSLGRKRRSLNGLYQPKKGRG